MIEEKYPEVQLLFRAGKEKGYLLYEEIHTVLSDEVTAVPDDLEEVYTRFSDLGIEIVTDPDRAARKRAALEAEMDTVLLGSAAATGVATSSAASSARSEMAVLRISPTPLIGFGPVHRTEVRTPLGHR